MVNFVVFTGEVFSGARTAKAIACATVLARQSNKFPLLDSVDCSVFRCLLAEQESISWFESWVKDNGQYYIDLHLMQSLLLDIRQLSIMCFIYYSSPVGERSIAISLSVSLSVHEHISRTAGLMFTNFFAQILCGRGSILLWRCCNTLCTSGFMDDVTFGRNGSYGYAWKAEPLTYYH